MIFQLSFSAKQLLDGNTRKRPYNLLIFPTLGLVVSVGIAVSIATAFWPHLLDFRHLTPEIFAEQRTELLRIWALMLAGVVLALGTAIFTWRIINSAIRAWRVTSAPSAEDYGLVEGLHFGDGTVEISSEGISLKRNLYSVMILWAAIEDGFQNEKTVGVIQKDGHKMTFGETGTVGEASNFIEIVRAHITGDQNEN